MSESVIQQRITHALGRVSVYSDSGSSDSPSFISPQPMGLRSPPRMAGYLKLWTTLADNENFLSLSGSQRGLYIQILLSIKKGRDDGTVGYSSWVDLGSATGFEGKTARKNLAILQENSLLTYTTNSNNVIVIKVPNYKHWQQIDVHGVREKVRKKSRKFPPLKPDQTRLNQIRPEHTSAAKPPVVSTANSNHQKAVKYFCDRYLEKYQVKYLFAAGKDGTIIKRLLSTFGFDFFCRLVDQIYITNDEFIVNKGKVTLGVLSACANKLTQEIMGRNDLRSMFSERERESLSNIAKGLGLK